MKLKLLAYLKTIKIKSLTLKGTLWLGSILLTASTFANPVFNNASHGVSVHQTPNSTTINQTTGKAIINWKSFNIGAQESTHFQQPAGGIALNRISPTDGASSIYGRLTATGRIILVNPAGIFFGPGSYVNVGGLIATTGNITDTDFFNGNYRFTNASAYPNASIVNEGNIVASQHGLVALMGPNVINRGVIQANLGSVVLASGNAYTINFDGSNLISFSVDEKTIKGNVSNTGMLRANGGTVLITARAASGVLDNVINLGGAVEAKTVTQENGEIILGTIKVASDNDAGEVRVASNLDVSGKETGQLGGLVEITGHNILIDSPSIIDASGDKGGGNVLIGGNYQGKGPLPNANAVVLASNAKINADAITHGNGGNIILWSDHVTKAYGKISARGGALGGDGGFVETSSHDFLDVRKVFVDLKAPFGKTGTWLLDPFNLTVSSGVTDQLDQELLCTTCTYQAVGTGANMNNTELGTALDSANIILTTQALFGAEAGNITVTDPVTWTSANTLTLDAVNNIAINANISGTSGSLVLNAISGSSSTSSGVTLDVANLSITSGTLTLGSAATIADTTAVTLANTSGVGLNLNDFNETIGSLAGGGTNGGNVSLGSGTLTLGNATSTTYSGVISGTGGLTKQGAGIFTLGGANNYSGTTTINAGTLRAGAANVLSSSSNMTLTNGAGGTLDLNSFDQSVGALAGGSGGGTITLGSATLSINNGFNTTWRGTISGTGGITKAGTGFLAMGGTQTYTGTTTINAGELRMIDNDNVLNANTDVVLANVSGARLELNGFDQTIASLSGGGALGGNVNLSSADLTVGDTTSTTYSGSMIGSGGITKQGTGILTLGGTNTYSGTTTLNDGTLRAGAANVFSSSSDMVLTNGQPGVLDLNSFNQSIGALAGGQLGGTITLGSGTLTINNGTDTTWRGVISGTGGITKQGAGFLAMGGTQTYTGTTTINAGELRMIDNANVLNANTAVVLADVAGAIFGVNSFSQTIASLAGGGATGGNVTLGSATLTVGDANNTSYSGIISGTGGLTKQGTGTLTLSGANTYSGATTINAGILQLGAAGVISDSSAVTLANIAGAIFDLNDFDETIDSLNGGGVAGGNVTLGSGTLTVGVNNADMTYGGVISGTGGFTKQGGGFIRLTGSNTYTGTTAINGGTFRLAGTNILSDSTAVVLSDVAPVTFNLDSNNETIGSLSGGAAAGSVTLGSGTLTTGDATNTTFTGTISGSGGLTKQGSGIFTLSGANSYTGTTAINAGTLRLDAAGVISDSSAVTLANTAGATLDLNNFSETVASLAGGGATGGNVSLGSATLTVGDAADATYAGSISGTGGLTKQGSGMMRLSGSNTYTGATTINAGTLRISGANILSDSTAVVLSNVGAATFDIDSGNETIASLSGGAAGGVVSLGSGTLTTGDGTNTTFSGVITGSGDLIKLGSGIFTLAGANTFTGDVTINAGTLSVTNAQGLGTSDSGTTVNSGTTLSLNAVNVGDEAVTLNDATLDSVGTASISGPITLGGASDIINANLGSVFTISGDINGAADLIFQGLGMIIMSGDIGNVTPVQSVISNLNTTISGSIATVASQTFSGPLTLTNDVSFTSTGGNVTFDGTINGAFDLIVDAANLSAFAGIIGGVTPLNSLTVSGSSIVINGGEVTTVGSQIYNGTLTLAAVVDNFFTTTGGGSISMTNGILGGRNVILNGNAGNNTAFALGGTLDVNDVTVNGGASATNTLALDTGGTQNWAINNNSGLITGIATVAGTFIYGNIQNVTGGSGNDNFTLTGTMGGNLAGGGGTNTLAAGNVANTWNITGSNTGTVTGVGGSFSNIQNLTGGSSSDSFNLQGGSVGGAINGGGGTNSLAANKTIFNTWTISGTDAGTVTDVSGGFSNIQNLTGGDASNTFTFANNARMTGTIDGGSMSGSNMNTINFEAYTQAINIALNNSIFNGSASDSTGTTITSYSNINSLRTNSQHSNNLTLPNKANNVVVDGALQGFVNDPLFFNGFNTITSTSGQDTITFNGVTFTFGNGNSVFVNGVEMFFTNFSFSSSLSLDVSSIIQQPSDNAGSSAPGTTTPEWVLISDTLNDNLNQILDDISKQYNADLSKIKINPFCLAAT